MWHDLILQQRQLHESKRRFMSCVYWFMVHLLMYIPHTTFHSHCTERKWCVTILHASPLVLLRPAHLQTLYSKSRVFWNVTFGIFSCEQACRHWSNQTAICKDRCPWKISYRPAWGSCMPYAYCEMSHCLNREFQANIFCFDVLGRRLYE